jgi:hypothetical protein
MPSEDELLPELRLLAEYNAQNLRDSDWENDFARICKFIEGTRFKSVTSGAEEEKNEDLPTKALAASEPVRMSLNELLPGVGQVQIQSLFLTGFIDRPTNQPDGCHDGARAMAGKPADQPD